MPKSIAAFILSILIYAAVAGCPRGAGVPLPDRADISAMAVTQWVRNTRHMPDFDVPEDCWDEILAALSPAEYERFPKKWEILGQLQIETKSGGTWCVGLYRTDDAVGAFSSGPTFEDRRYYRGGNSKRLAQALEKAAAESEKPKGQATKPGKNGRIGSGGADLTGHRKDG